MKQYSKESFIESLGALDWTDIMNSNDVDEAWTLFKARFLSVLDSLAPIKHLRIKQNPAKWISHEILESIRKRDHALTKFKRTSQQQYYDEYIKLRNQVKYKINKAKSQYYITTVNDNLKQPQKLWSV